MRIMSVYPSVYQTRELWLNGRKIRTNFHTKRNIIYTSQNNTKIWRVVCQKHAYYLSEYGYNYTVLSEKNYFINFRKDGKKIFRRNLERRNSPYFLCFPPNSIALLAKYVTVVKYRPIMSVKYCLLVPVFHFRLKLTHPAARYLRDSWATCLYNYNSSSDCSSVWQAAGELTTTLSIPSPVIDRTLCKRSELVIDSCIMYKCSDVIVLF